MYMYIYMLPIREMIFLFVLGRGRTDFHCGGVCFDGTVLLWWYRLLWLYRLCVCTVCGGGIVCCGVTVCCGGTVYCGETVYFDDIVFLGCSRSIVFLFSGGSRIGPVFSSVESGAQRMCLRGETTLSRMSRITVFCSDAIESSATMLAFDKESQTCMCSFVCLGANLSDSCDHSVCMYMCVSGVFSVFDRRDESADLCSSWRTTACASARSTSTICTIPTTVGPISCSR